MTLLRLLTCIYMYQCNSLLDHLLMIMIVYGYTLSMKISTENTDKKEWVTTSFCENPRRSSLKESIPELNDLIVI